MTITIKTQNQIVNNDNEIDKDKKKLIMLKNLITERQNFYICNEIYNKIIIEYNEFCLLIRNTIDNNYLQQIANYQNKIYQIEIEIEGLEDEMELKIKEQLREQGDYIDNIKLAIEFKKDLKEQEQIIMYKNEIIELRNKIKKYKDFIIINNKDYDNRYIMKYKDFIFHNDLQNEIKTKQKILNMSFSIIKDNEILFLKIYDKINYLFLDSNIFIKNEEKPTIQNEWFAELSSLTLFQFEFAKEYFKNNGFSGKNYLKEFKEKANEIKNIKFLLSN